MYQTQIQIPLESEGGVVRDVRRWYTSCTCDDHRFWRLRRQRALERNAMIPLEPSHWCKHIAAGACRVQSDIGQFAAFEAVLHHLQERGPGGSSQSSSPGVILPLADSPGVRRPARVCVEVLRVWQIPASRYHRRC